MEGGAWNAKDETQQLPAETRRGRFASQKHVATCAYPLLFKAEGDGSCEEECYSTVISTLHVPGACEAGSFFNRLPIMDRGAPISGEAGEGTRNYWA